ncbi:MAG TPA: 16S rRNA (uracil(1498)-N(3))-methyltransferase, partial [Marinobacter sp.]|nr:16S rRNA (uracil(1498)-N(3))-methyltransferase [Marinobacter sp.]
LLEGKRALVAHPGMAAPCPNHLNEPAALCIGPEGGFTDYEVGKLEEAGCQSVHLGPRILRVETAVPVLVSRLFDACL